MSLLLLFGGAGGAGGTVSAQAAAATGTAFNATVKISVAAGQAAATGVANNVALAVNVPVNAGLAAATGTAFNATVKISVRPTEAAGVGFANDAVASRQVTGPADLRRVVLVDVNGATVATLGAAEFEGSVRYGRNGEHDSAAFSLPVTSPDVALIAGSTGTRFRKVQLWRGTRLLLFGTIVDWRLQGGRVTFDVAGASSDLAGVMVGPLTPTNHLTNGSFELGFAGWQFAKTISPFTFTTYTARDARSDVNPSEEVCIVSVGGVSGYDASLALRLYGATGTDMYGDLFGWEEIAISGGVRGRRVTLSGRVWLSTLLFTRYPAFNRGLMLARFPTTFTQTGANGGKTGWYTDMIEWQSTHVDENLPRDRWVEQSVTIDIPPDASEILHVRCCAPNGLIYYDSLRLDLEDRLESYQQSQSSLVSTLVAHAQDSTYGKVDLNVDVIATGGTGPLRDLVAAHADKANVWDLIADFARYDDGVDIRSRYTPTHRYIEVGYPRLGYMRPDRPLWSDGAVSRVERIDGNGANAYSAAAVRADNTDAPAWGSAEATSTFADGQIREVVGSASQQATRNDLDSDAAELLAASINPVTARVAIHSDWLDEYLDLLPGDWCPTNLVVDQLTLVGTYRVTGWELDENDVLHLDLGSREAPT